METTTLNSQNSVGEWVADAIERAEILERLGIDYCCGGKKPLAQACQERGLTVEKVIEEMTRAKTPEAGEDWEAAELDALCDHIEDTHHQYLRSEIPRLSQLLEKVAIAHQENHPEMATVRNTFSGLVDELTSHMAKEEDILFPMIREMVHASGPQNFHCGSIANPIRVMEMEHDNAGDALGALRKLTNDYQPPADACNTFRAVLHGLQQFERDLHLHIHKENNILFPRAIAREQA